MFDLVPELDDLGFVRKIPNFSNFWLEKNMGLFKVICLMYSFSENSGGKLLEQEALVLQFLLQKCLLLFLWYLRNYYSSVSEILYWRNLACSWSTTTGFIRIGFTIWYLWSFSQGDMLQDCSERRSCMEFHVSLVHLLSLIFGPMKLKSVPFFGTSSVIPFGPL